MEEIYKINPNRIITLNGVAIPMIEGTVPHDKYVKYLRGGGTVVETEETTIADIELEQMILPNVVDLNVTAQPISNIRALEVVTLLSQQPTISETTISEAITSTDENIKIGKNALIKNKKGIDNVAIGKNALNHNVSSGNVGVGKGSLATNREGSNNTALGRHSLAAIWRGVENVGIGANAGKVTSKNKNNNQSNESVFIGANTKPLDDKGSNEIVIGSNSIGHGSNTTTIGNKKTKETNIYGVIKSDGYKSSDGSVGITTTFKTIDGLIVVIKNGLVVSIG